MKALLVIDALMVGNTHICGNPKQICPLWNKDRWCCEYERNTGTKGCPLKPMPRKKGVIGETSSCYSDGWNDCIDEITGKEE